MSAPEEQVDLHTDFGLLQLTASGDTAAFTRFVAPVAWQPDARPRDGPDPSDSAWTASLPPKPWRWRIGIKHPNCERFGAAIAGTLASLSNQRHDITDEIRARLKLSLFGGIFAFFLIEVSSLMDWKTGLRKRTLSRKPRCKYRCKVVSSAAKLCDTRTAK